MNEAEYLMKNYGNRGGCYPSRPWDEADNTLDSEISIYNSSYEELYMGLYVCWELLHPFAHHCQHERNNSRHCWPSKVGTCCVSLHEALIARPRTGYEVG